MRSLTNSAAKFAYRIPVVTKGTANNTLTIISQPNDGDMVTIGEYTYTFIASTAELGAAYTVLIGPSTTFTAANLLAALTLDQGANTNQGLLYGTGQVQMLICPSPTLLILWGPV